MSSLTIIIGYTDFLPLRTVLILYEEERTPSSSSSLSVKGKAIPVTGRGDP
jgi:hypothetical protein